MADARKDQIVSEFEDGILTLRFNRPEKKNAINLAMYTALVEAMLKADQDPAVRVVLLTGTEGCFTSGNDLGDFVASPPTGEDSPVLKFLQTVSTLKKPLVAAVTGSAVGIGVTVLLHCDLVYSAEGAMFQLPFVNLGLCPEGGSTLLFPRLMGHQRSAELLLLGEPFGAGKAYEAGIVNAIFPNDAVVAMARKQALKLAAQPVAAVRLAKELLKRDYAAQLGEAITCEATNFMARLKSPEAAEAMRAFLERRAPDFSAFS